MFQKRTLLIGTVVLLAFISFVLINKKQATTIENSALVTISEHWVRATHPGQSVGAAYMTMHSQQDLTLTHVSANITETVEIHDMKMEKGIMKMRHLDALPINASTPVTLAPGGLHLMLFDLNKPLTAGESINFELCFKDKKGEITIVPLRTTVKDAVPHQH